MKTVKYLRDGFTAAVIAGNVKTVKTMLNTIPKFNPGFEDSVVVSVCCRNKRTKILKLLLKDPRIDPSANNNQAISFAAMFNDADSIELLLNDDRILKTLDNSFLYDSYKKELINKILVDVLIKKYDYINTVEEVELYLQML